MCLINHKETVYSLQQYTTGLPWSMLTSGTRVMMRNSKYWNIRRVWRKGRWRQWRKKSVEKTRYCACVYCQMNSVTTHPITTNHDPRPPITHKIIGRRSSFSSFFEHSITKRIGRHYYPFSGTINIKITAFRLLLC